jgi:hypothetical protein
MHTLSRVIGVLPDRATSLQLRRRATRRTYSCVAVLRDAQTSGAVLIAGEIPGASVIGELVPREEHTIVVR